MTRNRQPITVEPTPPEPQGNLLTVVLLVAVLFVGWRQYGGGGNDAPQPPPQAANPAATVFLTAAKLQAENYEKAAARLTAGETVVAVNTDLVEMNRAAISAAMAPLDAYFVQTLTGKEPAETAIIYTETAKELRRAP